MERRILASGLVILVVGFFLLALFWPIYGVSGEELGDKKEGSQYQSYGDGDEVTVYGTITEVASNPEWLVDIGADEAIWVELDGNFTFVLKGKSEIDFSEGDDIYCALVLVGEDVDIADVTFEYWKADGPLRPQETLDHVFYAVIGTGLVVTAVGVIRD